MTSLRVARNGGADPATIHYTVMGNGAANTPLGDTANNRPVPRFIYVASNGNLQLLDDTNTWVTYVVTAGQILNFRAQQVGANTTANTVMWC